MIKSILYVGSEIMPFAATGGLGDVMGSLPEAIKRAFPDTDVRAVMPLYSKIGGEWRSKMTFERWIMVNVSWRREYCGIFSLEKNGVKYYFIDNEKYFSRDKLYGDMDDGERFAFFSYAAVDLMAAVGFFPDVLHANDWQTALSVIKVKKVCTSEEYRKIKTVYTVHNMEYQGVYSHFTAGDVFGLDDSLSGLLDFNGCVNLTKAAVECSDFITTVSPRYAKEIQTEYFGSGLHGVLSYNSFKVDGIINGIDLAANDPETDKAIPYNYSASDISGKAQNKAELQKRFGLEQKPDVPLIGMVSRLASHKGFDLVKCVADEILSDNVQFVLIGTGDREYEDFFRGLAARHPGKASVLIAYDRALSKLVYSGADMFLMPSKSEPCGLAQMIASRYGTVPIVRETGGLYDTIKPYGAGGNGFTFASYNAHDMMSVVRQAEAVYRYKDKWNELVYKIMNVDFSWDVSAKKYMDLYEKIAK
ncbi:MAG: glycogen synthase GlgA [Clostridiales bacterium]|nr:glycogen synthase GlgA [Clostridiales bacterium]